MRAGKSLRFFKFMFLGFLGFNVGLYAQSHVVYWIQEYDQEEGLYED